MASNYFTQDIANEKSFICKRSIKQGRKPLGLGKPELVRLYAVDNDQLKIVASKLGYLFNKNEFVREAVHIHLNSVYTELLKPPFGGVARVGQERPPLARRRTVAA